MNRISFIRQELQRTTEAGNLRTLPTLLHREREVEIGGRRLLNLSSNDYLGIATDRELRAEFLATLTVDNFLPSSSSSRLLTGNFSVCSQLELRLAASYGAQAALLFNSGYHANTGILPAVADAQTLILADKLVHASLIDGIRLSYATCIRYHHADYRQLERLLQEKAANYHQVIIVTESIFSMDGDVADLVELVRLKRAYPNVLLYVDEAHAVGVCGDSGLGLASQLGVTEEIDLLVGTFGKALGSVGAYVVCSEEIRCYLINRMRTFIYTTALPPLNWEWTLFVWERLVAMKERRQRLNEQAQRVGRALSVEHPTHILPFVIGSSHAAIECAAEMQRQGFYVLPLRPPTVPEGTSRLRFSLTATTEQQEVERLVQVIHQLRETYR